MNNGAFDIFSLALTPYPWYPKRLKFDWLFGNYYY
jgi:hypothetical protein